jgi:histidinol-phosphatase
VPARALLLSNARARRPAQQTTVGTLPPGTPSPDLELAQRAALAGAALGLQYFQRVKDLRIDYKADGSYVTDADRHVEQTVRSILLSERPDDACLGEETGEHGAGRRRWILDGIDGTAEFLRGESSWQTLIALEDDGRITVAIAAVPVHGQLWWAVKGDGAYIGEIHGQELLNRRRIHVADPTSSLEQARLGIVPDYQRISATYQAVVDDIVDRAHLTSWQVHAGLLVANGELDLAVQLAGKIWDYAAPSLIVEEAGGVFSGSDGKGHPVFGHAVYASNPAIHGAALELLHS